MKEFKRILFPVDLSESSTRIIPYVQAVAEKFGYNISAKINCGRRRQRKKRQCRRCHNAQLD